HGHAIGDKILITIARNMHQLVGKDGSLARFSGSDIMMVLKGDCDPVEKTNSILDALQKKIILDDGGIAIECFVEAYAGISSFPKDAHSVSEVFKHADIAMLEATNRKKDACVIYDDKMDATVNREFEIERLIKKALANNGFYFVYQPQFEMKDKKLRGFEALIRMNLPGEQNVSPGEFIAVAEHSDLICSIDKYVITNVLKQFKTMVGDNEGQVGISINVSASSISNPEFPDGMERLLRENEVSPSWVEIEITEYCLAESADVIISNIRRLRDMSIKVALDDFGTGYTSLSYLSNMPINLLKIDKTLVDNIVTDKKSYDFISAIISMGHLMGCEVISEGVESEEQIEMLQFRECDYIQGFAWGKPLSYDEAAEMVKQLR
ncbi:MAG: EAL domain-containing protein, partial [Bacteroidaceae bacterium]|nr:EAL domain-containing protein [Bacteroidaceae bacterium]